MTGLHQFFINATVYNQEFDFWSTAFILGFQPKKPNQFEFTGSGSLGLFRPLSF